MQAGHGIKPDKLDKYLNKLTLRPQEQPLLLVRSNNMRPLSDALIVTTGRVLAVSTGTGEIKFSVPLAQIAQTEYDPKGKTVRIGTADGDSMTFKQVHADDVPVVQHLVEQLRLNPPQEPADSDAGTPGQADPVVDPNRAADGPLQGLGTKARRKVAQALNDDETVVVAHEGEYGAVVGTDKRILIVKWGVTTGSFLSTQANSWGLRQVTGIEAHQGMTTRALVVQASGAKPVTKFGRFDKGSESVAEASNALFVRDVDALASQLRELIAAAHEPAPAPVSAPAPVAEVDTAEQIRKLAALRDEGLLTDEEFTAKKRQILGL